MKKATVVEVLNKLTEEFELNELIERLVLVEKVEIGLQQLEEGKTRDHLIVKEIAGTW